MSKNFFDFFLFYIPYKLYLHIDRNRFATVMAMSALFFFTVIFPSFLILDKVYDLDTFFIDKHSWGGKKLIYLILASPIFLIFFLLEFLTRKYSRNKFKEFHKENDLAKLKQKKIVLVALVVLYFIFIMGFIILL